MRLLLKKVKNVLLVTLMLLSVIPFAMPEEIAAATTYEVKDIQSNGSMTTIGTYDSFSAAEAEMKKYPNGVITSDFSSSRTKIIAMTRGVAVSYSFRRGSNKKADVTMTIYQYEPNKNVKYAKTTYVASHNEMQYYNTVYNSSDGWMVHVNLGGFDGYAYLDQVDLIPFIYFENNLSINLGGNNLYDTPELFTITPKRAQFKVINGEFYFQNWSYYNGREMHNINIGKADEEWMKEGAVYYSYDYIHYYSDVACTKDEQTYYNYYMFLPVRSKSYCNPVTFDAYIQSLNLMNSTYDVPSVLAESGTAQYFFNAQETYGVNALLLYALAIHESGKGASNIAVTKYNLFGWSAYDNDTGAATEYTGVEDCVNQMAARNIRRYLDTGSTLFFGAYFGSKGNGFNLKYASDPYWGLSVAHWAYYLDKINDFIDYKAYKLGVVDDSTGFKSELKVSASKDAKTADYTNYGATYQKNNVFILNNLSSGFYQVQSSVELASDKSVPDYDKDAMLTYDFRNSVLYIDSSKINIISSNRYAAASVSGLVRGDLSTGAEVVSFSAFTAESSGLKVEGQAYNKAVSSETTKDIIHELVFINTEDNKEVIFSLANTDPSVTVISEELTNKFTGFSQSKIDLSKLSEGATYKVVLRVRYTNCEYQFDGKISLSSVPDVSKVYGSLKFRQESDGLYVDSILKNQDNVEMTGAINVMEWNGDQLHITGVAVLRGVALTDPDKIKRQLTVYDLESGYSQTYDLAAYCPDDGIPEIHLFRLPDGINYYYAWYDVNVDLGSYPDGEYLLKIDMTVTDAGITYSGSLNLGNTLNGYLPGSKMLDTDSDGDVDMEISVDKVIRDLSAYRIRINRGNAEFLEKLANVAKPSERNTNYSMNDFTITDEGNLHVKGFMYMYGIAHSEDNQPAYKLYLVQNGIILNEYDLSTSTGLYDVTKFMIDEKDSYAYAWYDEEIRLADLKKGTYDVYIQESIGEFNDMFHAYDLYAQFEKTVTAGNITLEISASEINHNLVITIK